jgi:hypothetical protein
MAKNIEESQQSAQGKAIGSQGNQAGSIPDGTKGNTKRIDSKGERDIPNQERSSASNSDKSRKQ